MCAVVIALGLLLQGCATLTGRVVDTSAGHIRAYEGKVVALRFGASEPEGFDLDSKLFVGTLYGRKRILAAGLRSGTGPSSPWASGVSWRFESLRPVALRAPDA